MIEPEVRLIEIERFLKIELKFDNKKMTVEDYFRYTWNEPATIYSMEKISLYLSKMPAQNGKHDKDTLSRNDEMEMKKGVRWTTKDNKKVLEKSRYMNFSDAGIEEKVSLGLNDIDDLDKF